MLVRCVTWNSKSVIHQFFNVSCFAHLSKFVTFSKTLSSLVIIIMFSCRFPTETYRYVGSKLSIMRKETELQIMIIIIKHHHSSISNDAEDSVIMEANSNRYISHFIRKFNCLKCKLVTRKLGKSQFCSHQLFQTSRPFQLQKPLRWCHTLLQRKGSSRFVRYYRSVNKWSYHSSLEHRPSLSHAGLARITRIWARLKYAYIKSKVKSGTWAGLYN